MAVSEAPPKHPFLPGHWVMMRHFPDKPSILVLGVVEPNQLVRGLTVNEQGEVGVSLYVIEMLKFAHPSDTEMKRVRRALRKTGLSYHKKRSNSGNSSEPQDPG